MGSQVPFTPEDLKAAPKSGADFVKSLQAERKRKYSEAPPFLAAIISGEATKEDLQLWVKDFYPYWDEGLVYATGAIYTKNNDEPTRTQMLRRLVDIEGKEIVNDLTGWTTPAYEELWLRFGEGLGLDRSEVSEFQQFTRTYMAMRALMTYSRHWEWNWLDGIATWYAADLNWKEYYPLIRASLKEKYNVPEGALEFFDVFRDDVESHITWEEEALTYWPCTTERQLAAARAFRERLDIEDQLFVALNAARTGDRMPFQVPV
jgi:pyrroloquinoline-quinone synthase